MLDAFATSICSEKQARWCSHNRTLLRPCTRVKLLFTFRMANFGSFPNFCLTPLGFLRLVFGLCECPRGGSICPWNVKGVPARRNNPKLWTGGAPCGGTISFVFCASSHCQHWEFSEPTSGTVFKANDISMSAFSSILSKKTAKECACEYK